MKKRLFLSGPIGCGKSTLIRNTLGGAAEAAGGFITERALDEGGNLAGFDLLPAGAPGRPCRPDAPRRFLSFSDSGARRDDGVFRTTAVGLLAEAARKPFAIIDEFGGFELLVPEFLRALMELFNSSVPCVGVLKAPGAAESLRSRAGLPQEYLEAWEALRAALTADADTEILQTTGRYDPAAEAALRAWAEEYAHV